jgi:5-methylcytosine-specific restriction endonuclease McrA
MNKQQYREYLKSAHWHEVRAEALRRAEYRCQVCNADKVLNVHHRTYERIGNERQADLVVLCVKCHKLFHERDNVSMGNGWALVRSLTDALRMTKGTK